MSIQRLRLALATGAFLGAVSGVCVPVDRVLAAEGYPIATEARVGGDDTQTRLVVDLSRKIDLRVFTLADPMRGILDLPQVTFQLPPKTGEAGRGVGKAFRHGPVMPRGSRVVLALARPARVDKAFVLDPVEG